MKWFRYHSTAVDNPKIQKLPSEVFKSWVNFMCLACERDGYLPPVSDIAFRLRTSNKRAEELRDKLVSLSLVNVEDGRFRMHDWAYWQFKSDVSTNRVKAFRERSKKRSGNVPVNAFASVSVSGSVSEVKDSHEFELSEPYDWFHKIFIGEFQANTWQNAFPMAVSTPELLDKLRVNTPLWMRTKKYQNGYGKDAISFLRSGIWHDPPPAEMMADQATESGGAVSGVPLHERKPGVQYNEAGYPMRILS